MALVSRDTPPPACALPQAQETNQVARIRVRRQFLLVAVRARPRVLSAEVLDVPQPVPQDALRQAASEMRADAPENQAEIVFRVILNGQPAQQHEAAPVLDLPADFLDHRAQRTSKCSRGNPSRPIPAALMRRMASAMSRSCAASRSIE